MPLIAPHEQRALDGVEIDTVEIDTVEIDTVEIDTLEIDTLEIDTGARSMMTAWKHAIGPETASAGGASA
ncbi:hypothetical protein [Salinicola tamaricis]|uniref:hypothetical protein n=1 Tax=Salinicola tamaricis TaxID=1771309 RepID=UPI000D09FBD8|nr:hypothetical protein [Salinicola tamaricis]